MIVRVGTLSEVGKVLFADTDGVEAADVFAVIFVDLLDSEYELVSNDEVVELFVESSDVVVSSLGTVGEVENVFTGEDERVLINELSLVYAVLEFEVGKLVLTDEYDENVVSEEVSFVDLVVEVDTVIVDDEIEGLEEGDWEGLVTEVLVVILEFVNVVGKFVDDCVIVSVDRG